ncbi:MAG: hypothetical protein JWN86_4167 [Planctomycetota bacterium]|nr:hypothetical protein [Planctomycetota bacterium]
MFAHGLLRPVLVVLIAASAVSGQTAKQPKVQPGPSEPDLLVILDRLYGLRMFDDLLNPVTTTPEATAGLFHKAGPGQVTLTPILALGLVVPIHGGYYLAAEEGRADKELWSYAYKTTGREIEEGKHSLPPLRQDSTTRFDPGEVAFGLWIGNDQFHDRVFTEPARVARSNPRLAKQPYKAMVYPVRDTKTGKAIPNSYLICWEYSTNDDFQDVVCRVENVVLVKK